jgi:hypothetical protein
MQEQKQILRCAHDDKQWVDDEQWGGWQVFGFWGTESAGTSSEKATLAGGLFVWGFVLG